MGAIRSIERQRNKQMSDVIAATDKNFESEVMQSEQPVLVDFSATWCGPCKKLEPVVHELAGDYSGRLKVVKVDVDQAPNTAQKFGVMSVPTVLLIQGGTVKDQVVGLVSKQALADRVDKVL
jgi:thioredoxin 1